MNRSAGGARRVGRIEVLQIFAEPLDEVAALPDDDDLHLERSWSDAGSLTVSAVDRSGTEVGRIVMHHRTHGDPFYGKYSRTDEDYCYGSDLVIHEAGRGRKLGQKMTRVARCIAYEELDRGVKSLVAPDNTASLRCHVVAGFDPPKARLKGVRLGDRTLWLSRRALES